MKASLLPLSLALVASLSNFSAFAATSNQAINEAIKEALSNEETVKQIVRKALTADPKILVEAMESLRDQQLKEQKVADVQLIQQNGQALFNNKADPSMGAAKPKMTIALFVDFNCGYCKRFEATLSEVLKSYPDIKVVYKIVPILGPSSAQAATMALAAQATKSDKYLKFHRALMAKTGAHTEESIKQAATAAGLNPDTLSKYNPEQIRKQLNDNMVMMQKLGLTGTPAVVLNNQIIRGALDTAPLKEALDNATKSIKS